jgi:hypothetical protein
LATTLDVSVRKMQDESSLPDILVLLPCKQVKKGKKTIKMASGLETLH